MKSILLALCALAITVSSVSALGAKIGPDKPQPKVWAYVNGSIDWDHRANFITNIYDCSTPLHKGVSGSHSHDWQSMHNNGCSTSGNWWNSPHGIWQLKRSWCGCEGWGSLTCFGGDGNIKAWCYVS